MYLFALILKMEQTISVCLLGDFRRTLALCNLSAENQYCAGQYINFWNTKDYQLISVKQSPLYLRTHTETF